MIDLNNRMTSDSTAPGCQIKQILSNFWKNRISLLWFVWKMWKKELYTCIKMFRKYHISVNHSLRHGKISVVLIFHFYSRLFVNQVSFLPLGYWANCFSLGACHAFIIFFNWTKSNCTASCWGWFEAAERICRRKRKVKTFASKLFSLKVFQNHKKYLLANSDLTYKRLSDIRWLLSPEKVIEKNANYIQYLIDKWSLWWLLSWKKLNFIFLMWTESTNQNSRTTLTIAKPSQVSWQVSDWLEKHASGYDV